MPIIRNSTIFFARDYSIDQQGDVIRGGELTIFYDPFRMRDVYQAEKSGARTGMIFCEYMFANEIKSEPVIKRFQAPGGPVGSITPLALTIYIDPESDGLTLWFRGTRAAYDDSYDSNYGNNYHFSTKKFTGY